MSLVTTTEDLIAFAEKAKGIPYICVDTEFMRERTYFPKVCLIQLGLPDRTAIAIDLIANPDIDLTPLKKLFADTSVVKVLHSGRQDLEIFWLLFNELPSPLFDTQIAALALGFAEQVGYEALCRHYLNQKPDKGQQYTDWTARPLKPAQLEYALDDVRLLAGIYEQMVAELKERDREDWIADDTSALTDPAMYQSNPEDTYKRLKFRDPKPVVLAVARELAAWREREAKRKNVPKGRITRDEVLTELAIRMPKNANELEKLRGIPPEVARGPLRGPILDIIRKGLEVPEKDRPQPAPYNPFPSERQASLDMLKLLLKVIAATQDITPKLIACNDDLDALARAPEKAAKHFTGWRHDVFGIYADQMLKGKLGIKLNAQGDIELLKS